MGHSPAQSARVLVENVKGNDTKMTTHGHFGDITVTFSTITRFLQLHSEILRSDWLRTVVNEPTTFSSS